MMHVEIHVLRKGKDVVTGRLSLHAGKIEADPPDSQTLQSILAEPVRALRSGEAIYPDEDPQGFLQNLRYTYKSAYLRAGTPEQDWKGK